MSIILQYNTQNHKLVSSRREFFRIALSQRKRLIETKNRALKCLKCLKWHCSTEGVDGVNWQLTNGQNFNWQLTFVPPLPPIQTLWLCGQWKMLQFWRRTRLRLTEDRAFALFFRPHPGGFDSSRVLTLENLPARAKNMLMPGGQPGEGGGWAQLVLTDA